jgi:hypothetical protein
MKPEKDLILMRTLQEFCVPDATVSRTEAFAWASIDTILKSIASGPKHIERNRTFDSSLSPRALWTSPPVNPSKGWPCARDSTHREDAQKVRPRR